MYWQCASEIDLKNIVSENFSFKIKGKSTYKNHRSNMIKKKKLIIFNQKKFTENISLNIVNVNNYFFITNNCENLFVGWNDIICIVFYFGNEIYNCDSSQQSKSK